MDQVLDREPPPGGRGLRSLRRGTVLKKGDRIVAVGTGVMLERFEQIVGRRSDEDLLQAPGGVTSSRVVVISKRALGPDDFRTCFQLCSA